MKNKETKKSIEEEYYFNQIKNAIQNSDEIYPNQISKLVAICSLQMLVDKFKLDEYMDEYEVSVADFKEWFEKPAQKFGKSDLLYAILFKDKEDEK